METTQQFLQVFAQAALNRLSKEHNQEYGVLKPLSREAARVLELALAHAVASSFPNLPGVDPAYYADLVVTPVTQQECEAFEALLNAAN